MQQLKLTPRHQLIKPSNKPGKAAATSVANGKPKALQCQATGGVATREVLTYLSRHGSDDTDDADDEDDLQEAIKQLSFNSSSPIHSSRQMSDDGTSATEADSTAACYFTTPRHVLAAAGGTRDAADLANGCPLGPGNAAAAAEAVAVASDTHSRVCRDSSHAANGVTVQATQPRLGKCQSNQGSGWVSAGREKSPGKAGVVSSASSALDVSNPEATHNLVAHLLHPLVGVPAGTSQTVGGPGFAPGCSDGLGQQRLQLLESVLQLVGSLYSRG
jgi:hypothetical protein